MKPQEQTYNCSVKTKLLSLEKKKNQFQEPSNLTIARLPPEYHSLGNDIGKEITCVFLKSTQRGSTYSALRVKIVSLYRK